MTQEKPERKYSNSERRLTEVEIASLLSMDVPAHLGLLDRQGFPRIIPLWFLWTDGAFYMTGRKGKSYLTLLSENNKVSVSVDIEESEREDGQRPNRQITVIGHAELFPDNNGKWTKKITEKYLQGSKAGERAILRASQDRIVIKIQPDRIISRSST